MWIAALLGVCPVWCGLRTRMGRRLLALLRRGSILTLRTLAAAQHYRELKRFSRVSLLGSGMLTLACAIVWAASFAFPIWLDSDPQYVVERKLTYRGRKEYTARLETELGLNDGPQPTEGYDQTLEGFLGPNWRVELARDSLALRVNIERGHCQVGYLRYVADPLDNQRRCRRCGYDFSNLSPNLSRSCIGCSTGGRKIWNIVGLLTVEDVRLGPMFQRRLAIVFPWSLVVATVALTTVIVAVIILKAPALRAKRIAHGCCGGCGYDLQGNVTGVCPECGTRT